MAEMKLSMGSKFVSLSLSDDEDKEDCVPQILNTISLQGCSELSFEKEPENEDMESLLYPECEITETMAVDEVNNKETEKFRNNPHASNFKKTEKDEEKTNRDKKRIRLTQLPAVKHHSGPKQKLFTSRRDDTHNVVDAGNLALQERLFKTKELFDTFLRVCQDQENGAEMERVVEKLSRAYMQARQEFLGSVEFQNILESETEKVNTSNTKPWLNLKLVLDEMKHNKKFAAPKLKLGESEDSQDAKGSNEDEPVIECPKKRRHLKKLEKTLRAINLKIKKLEEKEVDLSDEDSSYIKLDRYRTQFTKIYNKVCEIKGKLADADRPYLRKVSFAGTTYPHINRCIERYYNKHREFPDFQDIKKLVTIANEQENIQMPPVKIHSMAANAFKEFGEMLKRLRQYDDYDVIISYLDQQVDPARDNEQLQEELNKNALLFKKREQEVIDKFAAEDVGLNSGSNVDSENKPKKKKRKIIISNLKKNPSLPTKRHLSSSEDSDDDETEVKHVKRKKPNPSLSSSSENNSSEDESEMKIKNEPVANRKPLVKKEPMDKGKTLVGKPRVMKQGAKRSSPKKVQRPKTAISSDEESTPEDTKDNFTNYLGLQVTSVKNETKEIKVKKDNNKDEVNSNKEIRRSPLENKISTCVKSSSDSDSIAKSKPLLLMEVEDVSSSSDSSDEKSNKRGKQIKKEVGNNVIDSSSDSEPIAIVENIVNPTNKAVNNIDKKPKKKAHKKHIVNSKKMSWSCSSENTSSGSRTSDDESDKSEKKSDSDVELSTGTKDLSPDSSDSEVKKEEDKKVADFDESIVILSEDMPEVVKPNKNDCVSSQASQDSSDSDDICILSQDTEVKKAVAPGRSKTEETANNRFNQRIPNNSTPQVSLSSFGFNKTPPRRLGPTSSAPNNKYKGLAKRRLPNQLRNGNNNKSMGSGSLYVDRVNENGNRQSTLPQMINGAMRKTVVISRISRVCQPACSPESIPLIELD